MATRRRSNFTWVTWITGLLSSDAQCGYAAWLKTHCTYEKIADDSFDLDTWKVQHAEMVERRADQLRADGWTVTLEDQNKFILSGRVGTLSGKPDLVAAKDSLIVIEDCKGGKRRTSDRFQVLLYMFAWPIVRRDQCDGKRVSGRVVYRDGWVEVPGESFTPELRQRIVDTMLKVSGPAPLPTAPSATECRFCDISKADCPARIDAPADVITTTEAW